MKRWWVWVVLLLSMGVNVGILATLAAERLRDREPAPTGGPAVANPRPPNSPVSPISPVPGEQGPSGPGPNFRMLADRLGLEGEARDRFVEIQRRAFETMRAGRQRLNSSRVALRQELAAASPDRARIDQLLDETIAAQGDLERALVTSLLESRAVLDPDQQRLYMRFVEERLRPGAQLEPRRPLRDRLLNRRGRRP